MKSKAEQLYENALTYNWPPLMQAEQAILTEQMKLAPGWLPGIPLDCEGHISDRYEK